MIVIKRIGSDRNAGSRNNTNDIMIYSNSFGDRMFCEKDAFRITDSLVDDAHIKRHGNAEDLAFLCAEKALLNACILYLWHMTVKEEQTFSNVIKLLDCAYTFDYDECGLPQKTTLDELFEEVEKCDPLNAAVTEYKLFRRCAGNTDAKVILVLSELLNPYKGRKEHQPLHEKLKQNDKLKRSL